LPNPLVIDIDLSEPSAARKVGIDQDAVGIRPGSMPLLTLAGGSVGLPQVEGFSR